MLGTRIKESEKTIESHAKTKLILGAPKSEASIRVIPMTNRLYAVLKEHSKQKESSFVFSVNGHPREPRLITYHFQRIMKKAGLSDRHFHQLRHTFATRCNESTSDITSLSVLMGHHSTKMTLDIYTDSLLEQRIKVIEQMEQKEVSSTYT
ncbi:tyrosine-type recombinase/integrase [Vagococcus coleopterorum]|uniref:tyrosine-type recombinase/integrase n=1 Tax=Vagococcus coleopterorum TaxID=2714946 RepID=UPI0023AF9A07|nr:tyrosine-type recombinase/integrase [Vagococcus coleopterorum]